MQMRQTGTGTVVIILKQLNLLFYELLTTEVSTSAQKTPDNFLVT
jgi:hypothetical protein